MTTAPRLSNVATVALAIEFLRKGPVSKPNVANAARLFTPEKSHPKGRKSIFFAVRGAEPATAFLLKRLTQAPFVANASKC